jgi:hypothetical protein
MAPILKNGLAVHDDISDSGAICSEDNQRQEGVWSVARDRDVFKLDGDHITMLAGPQ